MALDKQRLQEVLTRQVARLGRRLDGLEQISRRYSWGRLALVLLGGTGCYLVFQQSEGWGWVSLLVLLAVFVVVARLHRRVVASQQQHRIWQQIKQTHLARMTHDWDALPAAAEAPRVPDHPFEIDLDITGPRSLLHLLDTTVSAGGSQRLRDWLLDPVPAATAVEVRQACVRELRPLAMFRERLQLYGTLVNEAHAPRWDSDTVLAWLARPSQAGSMRPYVWLLAAVSVATLTLAGLHLAGVLPPLWPYSLIGYVWLYAARARAIRHLFDEATDLRWAIQRFEAVLRFLENYNYAPYPSLRRLCAPLLDGDSRPSDHLRRLGRIATAAHAQKSEVLWVVLNLLGPWDLYFAYRLEQRKEALRDVLPPWLETWYDLEALSALATFGYLNPAYPLPTISAADPEPVFAATALGHPLLPDAERVANDFAIPHVGSTAIVTGSNMSGKSTFLRTLGVNLLLAYAGGPVCAAQMQTVLFRPFTCIRVTDSVNDGFSYFYAEVRRLKALLEALHADHPLPLFFLIDEIFRGTNNRERFLGSQAYIRALADGHGVGAISTHDLELVHLADEVADLRNYHFREHIEAGRMVFDYQLRAGPCPTTNALKIMALEGLPVLGIEEPERRGIGAG